ncbi:hypothetical protein Hanom_Chr17g01590671 [Helianthus anomalus]
MIRGWIPASSSLWDLSTWAVGVGPLPLMIIRPNSSRGASSIIDQRSGISFRVHVPQSVFNFEHSGMAVTAPCQLPHLNLHYLFRFSPTLPGPDNPADCSPDRIVVYTLSFSSCVVRYPLSAFKVNLLRHFGVHFSQLHPLGFMRVVHFELSCVAVFGEPSRKDSVSPPCYSFMPTSTYPKEWKSRFIFVYVTMMPESPPLRDPKASTEDSIPVLSADEIVQWKRMYENPTRAFTFPEGVLAMGGLSPFYSVRPRAFFGKKVISSIGFVQR